MSSNLTPKEEIFTNRPIPPDSPLNELRALWEYVEMHGDGFSLENWLIVEAALDRVARIVVAADRWAHAYEACSSDPAELRLWRAVRGVQEGVTLEPGEHPSPLACNHAVEFGSAECIKCGIDTAPGQARVYLRGEYGKHLRHIAALRAIIMAEPQETDSGKTPWPSFAGELQNIAARALDDRMPPDDHPPIPPDEWGNFA